ncbi:MAG TPA: DNA polymerase III subunit gamma/tau, partial [Caldithrix abyssi]|nr:DNA polymerase III subunit gamma/tau [Caldithrix abyssi]
AIIQGRSMDVMEIDGASNRRIEEIRNLRENINYTPSESRYRIYIIDEVHMLTNEAFNALLKTLEEPPAHAIFIFATTEIHRVPATILSRCQRYDFKRIPLDTIKKHLKLICDREKIGAEDDALLEIAKKADGSMRDSQSILDQIISFSGQNVTLKSVQQALGVLDQEVFFKLSALIAAHDIKGILLYARELFGSGVDLMELLTGLEEHFRNLLVSRAMESADLLEVSEMYAERYIKEAQGFEERDLISYLTLLGQAIQEMKWSPQPYLKFELSLVKMAQMPETKSIEAILRELSQVKKKALKAPKSSVSSSPASALATDVHILWPKVVKHINSKMPTLGSVLAQAEPQSIHNGHLRVSLRCERFNSERLDKNMKFINAGIREVTGQPLGLKIDYEIVESITGRAGEKLGKVREEKLEKLEQLRKENVLFNKFVEELGLEPDF